ncbi:MULTISPECIES: hypothetical protein [Promicromonospora]|uniref:DNA-binding phage zinc finger domain-containing protein n=2 Tax=Promicromonospora TaxID=43676 RepID=A0ABW4V1G0_9MICO
MFMRKSVCHSCGRTGFRYDQGLYDPVAGRLLTRSTHDPGDFEERYTYLPHECLDEDIEEYQRKIDAVVQSLERLREETTSPWDQASYADARVAAKGTRQELQELVARHSLERDCPRCGAGRAEPCENLVQRRSGRHVPTKHPHDERVPAVETVAGREIAALRDQVLDEHDIVSEIYHALSRDESIDKLLQIARRRQ